LSAFFAYFFESWKHGDGLAVEVDILFGIKTAKKHITPLLDEVVNQKSKGALKN